MTQIALDGLTVKRPVEIGVSNSCFMTDIEKFKEDLGIGLYGKYWQEKASKAMEERACGTFDAWKEREAERFWGQRMV